jgi:dTDP-4-dehydrorhamnose 3,5-epimerase
MNVPLPKYVERGSIHDVAWIPLKRFDDSRGWLTELFRNDR